MLQFRHSACCTTGLHRPDIAAGRPFDRSKTAKECADAQFISTVVANINRLCINRSPDRCAPTLMLVLLVRAGNDPLTDMIRQHARAMLGVPWAGGAAFIVCLAFQPVFGNMEFKAIGFEFKGHPDRWSYGFYAS